MVRSRFLEPPSVAALSCDCPHIQKSFCDDNLFKPKTDDGSKSTVCVRPAGANKCFKNVYAEIRIFFLLIRNHVCVEIQIFFWFVDYDDIKPNALSEFFSCYSDFVLN